MFIYVKLLKFAMFIYAGTTGLSDFLALKLSQESIIGLLLFSLLGVDALQKNEFYGSFISHKFLFLVR